MKTNETKYDKNDNDKGKEDEDISVWQKIKFQTENIFDGSIPNIPSTKESFENNNDTNDDNNDNIADDNTNNDFNDGGLTATAVDIIYNIMTFNIHPIINNPFTQDEI